LIALVALYILSPADACPGPIDDLIVLLLGIARTRYMDRPLTDEERAARATKV
jgi:uncharacterized membrane protein YkvA (DUF1232 family)